MANAGENFQEFLNRFDCAPTQTRGGVIRYAYEVAEVLQNTSADNQRSAMFFLQDRGYNPEGLDPADGNFGEVATRAFLHLVSDALKEEGGEQY